MTATKKLRKHPKPPTRSALARPTGSALWAVMKAYPWKAVKLGNYTQLTSAMDGQPQRFIPIFDTREQAVAWAGTAEYVTMLVPNDPSSATPDVRRDPR